MSYITSTWLGSQYARKWAIASIIVDLWEKRIERNLGTAAFLLWGAFWTSAESEGGGCWLAVIDDPMRVPCWKAGSS